jgi:acyl-CoA thioester hydrolase
MNNYKHIVQYYETDKMGVTHHSNYLRFMEEARVNFLKNIGWGYDKMEAEHLISPVVDISCKYIKPTTFADEIIIKVNVEDVTKTTIKLSYVMTVGESVVCYAHSSHCFLNGLGKPVNVQKLYPSFCAALEAFKVDLLEC